MNYLKNAFGVLIGLVLIFLLILAIPQGVKLAEGSSKATSNTAYPPPTTPLPSFSTPTTELVKIPSQTPSPTAVQLENGWYLYEDKDAGYSISYPPEAHITTALNYNNKLKTVNIQFIRIGKSGGYQGMVIDIFDNQNGSPVENVIEKIYGDSPLKPSSEAIRTSIHSLKTGNTNGFQTIIPPTITELTILIPRKTDVLFIAPVHGPAVDKVDPEVLQLFYKILDTLKVTP